MKHINITKSSMPSYNEYCNEIKELWDSHWLTNMGVKHKQLQEQLEKFLGCTHVTLYTNGHLALENILAILNLNKGGEIITSPFTFASTTNAIVRNGFKPVFCDIKQDDYTIDANKIEKLITDKTVAIVPVHVYGNICDVEKINKIAKKYKLKVIYDAAHAFGVKRNGVSIANFGDASMFSFHATKVFNTIEGGAVCYSDDKLVAKLDSFKNFGLYGQEDCLYVGGNAKMNEFQAAMGICNLRHIDEEIKKRRKIVEYYRKLLCNNSKITLCKEQKNVTSNYAYFPILLNNNKVRDFVFNELKKYDIITRKYFYPITSEFSSSKIIGNINKTPIAKDISERILTLPLYADLKLEEVKYICDILQHCLNYS